MTERRERPDVNGGRDVLHTRGKSTRLYVRYVRRESNGEKVHGGEKAVAPRARGPQICAAAPNQSGGGGRRAIHPQSIYRVTA